MSKFELVSEAIREARQHASAVDQTDYNDWELDSAIDAIDAAIDAMADLIAS